MPASIMPEYDFSSHVFPDWDGSTEKNLTDEERAFLEALLVCDVIGYCPDSKEANRLASRAIDFWRQTEYWNTFHNVNAVGGTFLAQLYGFTNSFKGYLINSGVFRRFSAVEEEFSKPIARSFWENIRTGKSSRFYRIND